MIGTELRKNHLYYKVYLIYMNLITHGLIPLLALTFLNTNVLLSLRRVSQERLTLTLSHFIENIFFFDWNNFYFSEYFDSQLQPIERLGKDKRT